MKHKTLILYNKETGRYDVPKYGMTTFEKEQKVWDLIMMSWDAKDMVEWILYDAEGDDAGLNKWLNDMDEETYEK